MKKRITLKAFDIAPALETIHELNLSARLFKALEQSKSVNDRFMLLSEQEIMKEGDFIASYRRGKSTLFGSFFRMRQGEATQIFAEQLQGKTIDLDKLSTMSSEKIAGHLKDFTYFYITKDILILKAGHLGRKACEVYFNYLIKNSEGGDDVCKLTPKLGFSENVELGDVRSIDIAESHFQGSREYATISRNLDNVKDAVMKELIADADLFKDIQAENIISASIQLKVKIGSRQKKDEEKEKALKALLRSAESDDIVVALKNGKRLKGSSFEQKTVVDVDTTSHDFLNERELEGSMAEFAGGL